VAERALVAVAGVVILGAAGGAFYEKRLTTRDLNSTPAPGTLVDVGGYRLHLWCMGSGEPTVVAAASELGHARESAAQVARSRRALIVPLVVVSEGQRQSTRVTAVLDELQKEHLQFSTRSCRIIAVASGHGIAFDEPEVVVEAIREVLASSLADRAPDCGAGPTAQSAAHSGPGCVAASSLAPCARDFCVRRRQGKSRPGRLRGWR
jgi:hypothetical protein